MMSQEEQGTSKLEEAIVIVDNENSVKEDHNPVFEIPELVEEPSICGSETGGHVTKVIITNKDLNPKEPDVIVISNEKASVDEPIAGFPCVDEELVGTSKVDEVPSVNILANDGVRVGNKQVQIQPIYPAAHPLPSVKGDVKENNSSGEMVAITVQPAYPSAHLSDKNPFSAEAPTYPAAHPLTGQTTDIESGVSPTLTVKHDSAKFDTVKFDSRRTSSVGSVILSTVGEPVYPAAHPHPGVGIQIHDDGMNEIQLPPVVEPGGTSQSIEMNPTANGISSRLNLVDPDDGTGNRLKANCGMICLAITIVSIIVYGTWLVYKKFLQ